MPHCFFVSDLHGQTGRYLSLWASIAAEKPQAVFLGGDLLPHVMDSSWAKEEDRGDFITDYLIPGFTALRQDLGPDYPRIFLILGNDDPRAFEEELFAGQEQGLWDYVHGRQIQWLDYTVMGYACIPPSPFLLKDWERYDVSRFVDPGCISPEEGRRTAGPDNRAIHFTTIAEELGTLAGDRTDFSRTILLSHCPPYDCDLDRAALDGKSVDHAPLDVHIGSIAIARFIATRQPLLSLHGHVHESRRITGNWKVSLGSTVAIGGANDTPELALVRFDPANPAAATLKLIASAG